MFHPFGVTRVALWSAALLAVPWTAIQAQQMDEDRYVRAERLLAWNVDPLVTGGAVVPNWIGESGRFWYRVNAGSGHEFVDVDPSATSRRLLFDHHRLAAAMSVAGDTAFDGSKLPFSTFRLSEDQASLRVDVNKRGYTCDLNAYQCTVGDTLAQRTHLVRSPDGAWDAYSHEHNLWIRNVSSGDSTQLTTDGEEYWAYGTTAPRPSQIIAGIKARPVLQWSPDSRRIAVQRMDERHVEKMPLYSSTSQRPTLYTYPYGLPGDSVIAEFDIHVVDVESRTNVRIDAEPQPYLTFSATGVRDSTWVTVKWKDEGERLYFVRGARAGKRIGLYEADLETGAAREIVHDTSATHVELNLDIVAGYPNCIWSSTLGVTAIAPPLSAIR